MSAWRPTSKCSISFPAAIWRIVRRQHRWIRGDWQIAAWCAPRVPTPDGWVPNPLSVINRWKILDNLRRSLVPIASVALLVTGWLVLPGAALIWSGFVGLVLLVSSTAAAHHLALSAANQRRSRSGRDGAAGGERCSRLDARRTSGRSPALPGSTGHRRDCAGRVSTSDLSPAAPRVADVPDAPSTAPRSENAGWSGGWVRSASSPVLVLVAIARIQPAAFGAAGPVLGPVGSLSRHFRVAGFTRGAAARPSPCRSDERLTATAARPADVALFR